MAGIITGAQVKERLATRPGFDAPSTLDDPADYQDYADTASAVVMQRSGLSVAPAADTDARLVLEDLAIRLAILDILLDLYGTDADYREVNRRERDSLLKEIDAFGEGDTTTDSAGDAWLDVADTPLGDEDGDLE